MRNPELPRVKDNLTCTVLGSETLVYDPSTRKAYALNLLGSRIFQACRDGITLEQLRNSLREEGLAETDSEIDAGFAELCSNGFFDEQNGLDRRDFLKGVATAVAGVVVTSSVVAPSAASALSCVICALDVSGFPLDCNDCGRTCIVLGDDPVIDCTGSRRCCFEFTRRGANNRADQTPAGNGLQCAGTSPNELTGRYSCRGTAFITFLDDCNTRRDSALNGEQYYCCSCAGHPQDATQNFPAGGC